MRDFKQYDIWKLSHNLVLDIYRHTEEFPATERFSLISQMRRAAYSIPANFSEGCGRYSDKDFNRFLQICIGSAHELEYFLILSRDLSFLSDTLHDDLQAQLLVIRGKIWNLSGRLGR